MPAGYFVASYMADVTLSGTPATATITKAVHGLDRVNMVLVMPIGNTALSFAVNINPTTGDVTITGSATGTVRVLIF